jgi:S1-C subfamily serine protease
MKLLAMGCTLCVVLVALSGCLAKKQAALSPGGRITQKVLPAMAASYFISASVTGKDNTLQVERGMAVAVSSVKNSCVLLTNRHIIAGMKGSGVRIRVTPWTGTRGVKKQEQKGRVLKISSTMDAALILIPGQCTAAEVAADDTATGKELELFGQPLPMTGAMSHGIVSGYWQTGEQGFLMVSDALTTPGFSGSGVFDHETGKLTGLVTGKTADRNRGFAYILPVSRLRTFLFAP